MAMSEHYKKYRSLSLYVHMFIFFFMFNCIQYTAGKEQQVITVPVGVVLDLNSPLGSMVHSSIEVAVSDFYSQNPNHITRLKLHTKNAQTLLDANLAVMELLQKEQVHGVIGPQESSSSSSAQESLLAEIGKEHQVPVISFSPRNPPVSSRDNPYIVRTTVDHATQARALASICKDFDWHEVAVFYQDSDDGHRFLSHMNKALGDVEVRLAYMVSMSESAEDSHISRELRKLPAKQTRVFVVHMSPSLGSRFFRLAKSSGVLSEGYAWIVSDGLSNFMSEMDPQTREAMGGLLGIRPYVSTSSHNFKSFRERWRKHTILKNSSAAASMELNVYGLWAYDAVTALAIAAEKMARDYEDITSRSNFGQALLDEVSRTRFEGLSGEFEIVSGNLKLPAFEIFNVYGSGEKTVGFWSPERGRMLRDLSSDDETNPNLTSRKVVWPGDSMTKPESSAIPRSGVLRVGVPWKHGFTEFVSVSVDTATGRTNATGFSIDIFYAALALTNLPINYEFGYYIDTPNTTSSYDNVLHQIPQEFDMVVGDTTIWAPRLEYVDFSQPYSESGVVLVVKNNKPVDMWIFMKPLRWDLWLAISVSFVLMGGVILALERHGRIEEPTNVRHRTAYFTPVAVLAFPETNMVRNKWSLFVLVFWLFMAFILTQSYTANLAAILTVDQLKFAFSDDYYIGYQDGSFMDQFLTENLHIKKSRLRSYSSVEKYHEAMSKGSKHGGIDAIFDEIPYMKILIKTYYPQYKMVGPSYITGGFGFAFPKGSPLVSPFSKAIMDVTQGPNMTALERKHFGPGYSSQDPLSSVVTQETSSLRLYDFAGLFLIIGSVTLVALFFSETSIGKKIVDKTVNPLNRLFFHDARIHSTAGQNNDAVKGNSNGNGGNSATDQSNDAVKRSSTQENGNENNNSGNADDQGLEENVIEEEAAQQGRHKLG